MKILLTGKNGQVGFELQRALAPLGEVVAVDMEDCDLSNPESIRALVRSVKPQIIVNPAAYTAVDKAETDQATAYAVNAFAPGVIGEEAARLKALVVHYSTDYVFDGTKNGSYTECDKPNPQSAYGKSKLQGEDALEASGAKHIIFRTSWVFGSHGNNFARTMLKLAVERDRLSIVADQWGAPTSAALIADVTAQVLVQYKQCQETESFPYGIYNLVAAGETNWYEYARTVIDAADKAGKPLKLGLNDIHPITTAEYPLPAPRPENSRLNTDKIKNSFGIHLHDWHEGLDHILQRIL